MSRFRFSQRFAVLVGTASLAALAPVAAQAGTVIASSGPSARSYPVGAQVAASQRITLREGDQVSVLDNGGTRVLRGPGSFTLASQSSRAGSNAFAALTTQRSAVRARTGATRDPNNTGDPTNPNLFYVDIAAGGAVCLPAGSTPVFWRKDSAAQGAYTVTRTSGEPVSLTFAEKEMLAPWPDHAGMGADPVLTIAGPGLADPVRITFVWLDQVPGEAEEAAQTFIANGCMAQLAQLASALGTS